MKVRFIKWKNTFWKIEPSEVAMPLFFCFLLLGAFIFDEYGISMDEPIQRKHGIVSFEYVHNLMGRPFPIGHQYDLDVQYYDHRDYGVFFQMCCYGVEKILGFEDPKNIFLLRHLATFLLFAASVACFYQWLLYRFKKVPIALLGALVLLVSPRIFANAFYNPKDLPLLSWCIFAAYTQVRFLDEKTVKTAIGHGLFTALAINTRILAIYIPLLTVSFYLLSLPKAKEIRQKLIPFSLFLLALSAFTILFWPFLWRDPLGNLTYSFGAMSHFRWFGTVFYLGEHVSAHDLPWHYIPVWIGITTPILYLVLALLGIALVSITFFRGILSAFKQHESRNDLLALAHFIGPVLAVIVLGSTLYNGWRHLYFVYPALIYLAVLGLAHLSEISGRKRRKCLYAIVVGYITIIGGQMLMAHPFQQVYFNETVSAKAAQGNFELDYYGLSYRQGIEKLLTDTEGRHIRVAYANFNGMNNGYILSPSQRARVKEVPLDSAQYYMTNKWEARMEGTLLEKGFSKNFVIGVWGMPILHVYKRQ